MRELTHNVSENTPGSTSQLTIVDNMKTDRSKLHEIIEESCQMRRTTTGIHRQDIALFHEHRVVAVADAVAAFIHGHEAQEQKSVEER